MNETARNIVKEKFQINIFYFGKYFGFENLTKFFRKKRNLKLKKSLNTIFQIIFQKKQ